MRAQTVKSFIVLPNVIQLVGGVVTALLALGIYVYILAWDASPSNEQRPLNLIDVLVFLVLVVPAALIGVGAYLQTLRRKPWAFALVLIGGLGNAIFVGLYVGFLFAYTGNILGQRAVLGDLIALSITLGAAVVNLLLWVALPNRRLQPAPR